MLGAQRRRQVMQEARVASRHCLYVHRREAKTRWKQQVVRPVRWIEKRARATVEPSQSGHQSGHQKRT
jgi:hypothetical protein